MIHSLQSVSTLLNQVNDRAESPLYISIESDNPNIALFLLEQGPTPDVLSAKNIRGNSLLHAAVKSAIESESQTKIVDILLQLGTEFQSINICGPGTNTFPHSHQLT